MRAQQAQAQFLPHPSAEWNSSSAGMMQCGKKTSGLYLALSSRAEQHMLLPKSTAEVTSPSPQVM